MAIKKEECKWITVRSSGVIHELGNIQGPILSPCWISISIIKRMIQNKRDVWEHDTSNYKRSIKLTLDNYNRKVFEEIPEGLIDDPTIPNDTYKATFLDQPESTESMNNHSIYVEILN